MCARAFGLEIGAPRDRAARGRIRVVCCGGGRERAGRCAAGQCVYVRVCVGKCMYLCASVCARMHRHACPARGPEGNNARGAPLEGLWGDPPPSGASGPFPSRGPR